MPRVPCRKFTLADVMILVGATALGLAPARALLPSQGSAWYFAYPMAGGTPLLISWTIAVLGLRARRPRPPIRRAIRQPGTAASLAAAGPLLVWVAILTLGHLLGSNSLTDHGIPVYSVSAGAAVIGAWAVLFGSRTARFEPGWIDLMGVALGVGWVTLFAVVLVDAFL